MLSIYPAIFYREKNNSFSVVFPDLNHLATEGENITEAVEMAIDCLAGYIYSAKQEGEVLPSPTSVEYIDIHCEDDEDDSYEYAFVNLIAVDVEEYAVTHFEKAVKKTLTIPAWLNEQATAKEINFSSVLKNYLLEICSHNSPDDGDSSNVFYGRNSIKNDFGAVAIAKSALGVWGGAVAAAFTGTLTDIPKSKKSVKKTVTIPKWLNERAMAMDINFSNVLREGLISACQNK